MLRCVSSVLIWSLNTNASQGFAGKLGHYRCVAGIDKPPIFCDYIVFFIKMERYYTV
jgi:hypothetical protein